MNTRIQKKLNRLNPVSKVVCYLRGYDCQWHCLSEVYYSSSSKAEKECTELNRNPGSELNYRVECEVIS